MLTAVRAPSPVEEAVRHLVRARSDQLDDRKRTQQRLSACLLRHGCTRREGARARNGLMPTAPGWTGSSPASPRSRTPWAPTAAPSRPARQNCTSPRSGCRPRTGREPLAPAAAKLGAYRGIAELTALTLAAEVVDWRRFPSARAFMGFTGLIPSEYSIATRSDRLLGRPVPLSQAPAGCL